MSVPGMLLREFRGLTPVGLLSWERPKATGAVFAALLLGFAVFCWYDYTLVTFVCRLIQLAFAACGALSMTHRIQLTPEEVNARFAAFRDSAEPVVARLVEHAGRLLLWQDYMQSGQVLLMSFTVAFLGNLMSDFTFLFVLFLSAFSLPLAFKKNEAKLRQLLAELKAKSEGYVGTLRTKAAAMGDKKTA